MTRAGIPHAAAGFRKSEPTFRWRGESVSRLEALSIVLASFGPAMCLWAGLVYCLAGPAQAIHGILSGKALKARGGKARQVVDGTNLVVQSAEAKDPAVPNALLSGLRSPDLEVRFWCLQALLSVPVKYDLAALLPAMEDKRSYSHVRICDNALWVFEERIGKRLEGRNGDIPGFLKAWYGEHKRHLRWDSGRRVQERVGWRTP